MKVFIVFYAIVAAEQFAFNEFFNEIRWRFNALLHGTKRGEEFATALGVTRSGTTLLVTVVICAIVVVACMCSIVYVVAVLMHLL